MARSWTKEQQKALDAKGKLTVLSAAAGSGKTTVLVEKALRIILNEEEKTPADSLLIATFSNASAKEFKSRIEKGINQKIKQEPNNSYAKMQKMALQKADISTIHAFCIKLARENFQLLDISPDFTICDEAGAAALHSRALDMAMEKGYTNKAFSEFVSIFGKSSQDSGVRDIIEYMYHWFSALPFPQKRAKELCAMARGEEFEKTAVYKYLLEQVAIRTDYIEYLAKRARQIFEIGEYTGHEDGIFALETLAQKLKDGIKSQETVQIENALTFIPKSMGRAKPKCLSSDSVLSIKGKINDTAEEISEFLEYLDKDRYILQTAQTSRYISALTDVFLDYTQKLLQLKKEEKSFEFSDFEHFAVQLLTDEKGNKTPLAQMLTQKYTLIMEDEFQDTSFVQDMIFTAITKEKEQNLFVVGDVKQSIYGFRKASPQIILEKRSRGIKDPTQANTIVLPHNFRSEVQVIEGINYLFEKIMTESVGGVSYEDGEQLKPPEGKTKTADTGTEIIVCRKQTEEQIVASRIENMLACGYEIVDNGKSRPVKPEDFCILLRNKKNFAKFSEALKVKNIQSHVRDDSLILEKPEVESIISLLRVISNPFKEIYLTATMFGDLFGFSLDEILKIRLLAKKENLYKALTLSKGEKSRQLLQTLKSFTQFAKVYSPDKLINNIITQTGYYTRLAFCENGEEKRENVRWFISFAKKYAQSYQTNLQDFLRYIDVYIESGKGESAAAQKPQNSVSIMTMHNSKGLEFPICFVSGLGTAFNKTDRSKRLMMDQTLGMATYANEKFGYNRSTAGIRAIKEKLLQQLADDEMRLLYVALTRAKNKLFLTAEYGRSFTENTLNKIAEKTGETLHPYAIFTANNPMEWVISGYLKHPQIAEGVLVKEDASLAGFVKFTFEDTAEKEEKTEILPQPVAVDLEETQKYIQGFNWQYPHLQATKLPIKVSVGEIAKAASDKILPKPFFIRPQKYTAAEKGSAMHAFVQHTDIAAARLDLEKEIDRIAAAGFVNPELLDKTQIEKFLQSSVAKTILWAENIHREKEFLVPYSAAKALKDSAYENDTLLVQGVIDCVAISKDKAVVIDYKTDRVENIRQLYERYYKQLELYRYATSYLFEIKDIKCIIYSFYLGEAIEF